jgi:hypothetical protein
MLMQARTALRAYIRNRVVHAFDRHRFNPHNRMQMVGHHLENITKQFLADIVKGLLLCWNFCSYCPEPKPYLKCEGEYKTKSQIEKRQARTAADSEQKDEYLFQPA